LLRWAGREGHVPSRKERRRDRGRREIRPTVYRMKSRRVGREERSIRGENRTWSPLLIMGLAFELEWEKERA